MRLPSIPQNFRDSIKRHKLKFIVLPIVALVGVAFTLFVSGVIFNLHGEEKQETNFGTLVETQRAPMSGPSQVSAVKEDNVLSNAGNVEQTSPTNAPQSSPTTNDVPVAISSTSGPHGYIDPFSYSPDRTRAEEKARLVAELEIEELNAKIREAKQRGKKENIGGGRGQVAFPSLDALPKIETALRRPMPSHFEEAKDQKTTVQAFKFMKVKLPGYNGVVLNGKRRAVILEDGNAYEAGSPIADGLFIENIVNSNEVYIRDVLGNVFRMRNSPYEVQVLIPSFKGI